jgi:hypothetical protein
VLPLDACRSSGLVALDRRALLLNVDTQWTFELPATHVAFQSVCSLSAWGIMSGNVMVSSDGTSHAVPMSMVLQVEFDTQRTFEMVAMYWGSKP